MHPVLTLAGRRQRERKGYQLDLSSMYCDSLLWLLGCFSLPHEPSQRTAGGDEEPAASDGLRSGGRRLVEVPFELG